MTTEVTGSAHDHVERVLRQNVLCAARKWAAARASGSEEVFFLATQLRKAIMAWHLAEGHTIVPAPVTIENEPA